MMICTKGEKDEFCEAVLNQEGEDVNRTGLGVVLASKSICAERWDMRQSIYTNILWLIRAMR